MQLNRRSFLRLSAGTAASAFLAACAAPAAPGSASEAAGAGAAPAAELVVWTFPHTENDLETIWPPLLEGFKAEEPNTNLRVEVFPWGGRREKMLTAYSAGEAPDLVWLNIDMVQLFGEQQRVLLPLQDAVDTDLLADVPEHIRTGVSWDGQLIMLPYTLDAKGRVANKALLDELEVDAENLPNTWDELRALGEKAKASDYYLTEWSTNSWGTFVPLVWQAGGNVFSEDLSTNNLAEPWCVEALGFMTDLFVNEWVPKAGAVGSSEEAAAQAEVDYLVQGKQIISERAKAVELFPQANEAGIELVIIPPFEYKQAATLMGAGCWGVFDSTKQQEAAITWLNFMMKPENVGIYASSSQQPPASEAGMPHWEVPDEVRQLAEAYLPAVLFNQDNYAFFSTAAVITAPYFQAAALGEMTVEEAAQRASEEVQAEMDAAV